jgi:hypothetical protein
VRPVQLGASGIRGRVRVQDTRTSGRVYNITQEDIRDASDVVAGMLQVNSQFVYALIDLRVTYSVLANRIVEKLGKCLNKVDKWFTISMFLGETMNIDFVYKKIKVIIHGLEMRVDLLPLKLYNFEVILGMDWLGKYKAQIDCFAKTMTF